MFIKSITVENYKSIGNNPPLKINLGDLTVITGTNDSGKTSFLTAAYLSTLVISSVMALKSPYIQKLASLEGSQFFDESVEDSPVAQSVIWELSLSKKEIEEIFQTISKNNSLKAHLDRLEKQNRNDIEAGTIKAFLEQINISVKIPLANNEFEYINDWIDKDKFNSFCSNFFNFNPTQNFSVFINYLYKITTSGPLEDFPRNINSLFIPSNTRDRLLNLSLDELDLNQKATSELVAFFKEISTEEQRRNGNYRKFIKFCQTLFPELEHIEIGNPVDSFIKEDLFISWTKNQIKQSHPLSRSGAGITNVLYIISKLLRNNFANYFIFIDEPENGLHPKLQTRLISLLRKLSKEFGVKIILSTHSPFIMQRIKENDKLYLVEHNGRQTIGHSIELEKKEEAFHALGAYLPLSLTANGIIFVEGQTEVKVLSVLLNKAGLDIDKEEILIIPLGGENLFGIHPRDIKKIHEKSIVIIDSDLLKSRQSGGSIKQSKLRYEAACQNAEVECILLREYRTIENMYPHDILATVLNITEEELTHDNFEEIPQIPDGKKVDIGEKVAIEMTEEKALEFPLIKPLLDWWEV